ncbi:hypothetical protein G7Y89_g13183 [Cudoniella acicularis]|uniref:Cyclopropane-fatty-acyl-phospholipid synthase n=1 Tax=Cudoniella acicularis TaxID=354080 RepID=A0A8H4RA18_9HELO|nr:hypothetical protein G7Y89_g13183 [Cudoniella acicularis]
MSTIKSQDNSSHAQEFHSQVDKKKVTKTRGSYLSNTLATFSRSIAISKLKNIRIGFLVLIENGVPTEAFGSKGMVPACQLEGFAEAYMDGIIACSDITQLLELLIMNRDDASDYGTIASFGLSVFSGFLRAANTISKSLSNVSEHYDLSNQFFKSFLSPDMTYSCPIWSKDDTALSDSLLLEQAQLRKLHRIIAEARIKSTDHVLEIGTGWGSFAIEAVRHTGCTITSVTLSIEQKEEAELRISAAGFTDKITVLLQDYRHIQKVEGGYDKVVSIEMIEHVGREHLGDFIRKHIFPGANVPSVTQVITSIHQGSAGKLIPDKIDNIGGHYVKALRIWHDNFTMNFESQIRPELLRIHHPITAFEMEKFRRKWEYYFRICEAGFRTKTLGCVMFTVGRERNIDMIEDIVGDRPLPLAPRYPTSYPVASTRHADQSYYHLITPYHWLTSHIFGIPHKHHKNALAKYIFGEDPFSDGPSAKPRGEVTHIAGSRDYGEEHFESFDGLRRTQIQHSS